MKLNAKDFVLRGVVAGAAGGAATALFTRFVTETQIGRAIGFEDASMLGAGAEAAAELSRSTQRWGAMAAAVLYGVLVGVITSIVVAALHDRIRGHDESSRVLRVAAAAFVATVVLPGLKYPPNPPTVGNADTITERTTAYLSLIVVSTILVFALRWVWQRLAYQGIAGGARFLLAGAIAVASVTVVFNLLPPSPDRVEPPTSEAAPALTVSGAAPAAVLDAMAANAKALDDEAYRNPSDPSEPLDLSRVSNGSDLVGAPVAVSTTKLTPHAYTTMVWSFRLWSFAGLALMWAVMAGMLGLLLDRATRRDRFA